MDDIRDHKLIDKVNTIFSSMNNNELDSAHKIISVISNHLFKKHFVEKKEIDINALVKTFEELDEIGIAMIFHRNKKQ